MEDWEVEVIKKQDPLNEAKLLQKYGGLVWYDPDTKNVFTASTEEMQFSKVRGYPRGYCVFGLTEDYDPKNPNDDHWEPWVLNDCLHGLIASYYETNPSPDYIVLKKKDPDEASDDYEDEA